MDQISPPFVRLGPRVPATPLVLSVPHAGREYPPALLAISRLPAEALAGLEDRFVDRLVGEIPRLGVVTFVARRARAWIDLNRDERELDPVMVVAPPPADRLIASAKLRAGLGLIPRRIPGVGDIWRRRLTDAEVEARLASVHRPWHTAIAQALEAARARFGVAFLIDLHSMPPLAGQAAGRPGARIVLGDRYGLSCAPRLAEAVARVAVDAAVPLAHNAPYAGGYTLERQARPAVGVHALQIEVDRSLYLAGDLRTPGSGLDATKALIDRMARAALVALDELKPGEQCLAAE